MSLRELARWAEGQARRLASDLGLDSSAERDNAYFALAQTLKLGVPTGQFAGDGTDRPSAVSASAWMIRSIASREIFGRPVPATGSLTPRSA